MKKVTVKKDRAEKQIAYQRDILGRLITLSHQTKLAINIEKAITYPLSNNPPALTLPDGSPRKSVKSKLFDAALSDLPIVNMSRIPGKEILHVYFLDLIAMIRIIPKSNESIRAFTWKILQYVPKQCDTIYLVCDSYKPKSIKSVKRATRGSGEQYFLSKADMKIPSDLNSFMKNGQNKTRLLELMQQVIIEDKQKLMNKTVYLSAEFNCFKITFLESSVIPQLISDHEEADTKIVALVKSTSIDIIVLFVLHCSGNNILLDTGHGNPRKTIDLSTPILPESGPRSGEK